ncbi:MAG: hypothetical protein ACT4TC_08935, partial [Myxococcaceae bacterium]
LKPAARVELKKITGSTVELVPTTGQLPYCLVFTASKENVVRQLTMNFRNESISCEAGKPIRNVVFKIPHEEGTARIFVIFSDRKLNAGTIAQQIYENIGRAEPSALDLRAPGQVVAEKLEFTPSAEGSKAEVGSVVSPSGEVAGAADAGNVSPEAPVNGG